MFFIFRNDLKMEAAVLSLVVACFYLVVHASVQVIKILSKHISDDISAKVSTELHQICPFIHPSGLLIKLCKTKIRLLHENNIFITVKYKYSTYVQILKGITRSLISKENFITVDVPEILFFVDLTKFHKASCTSDKCPNCNPECIPPKP